MAVACQAADVPDPATSPATGSPADPVEASALAAVAMLAERSALCWVAVGEPADVDAARPVWHHWYNGAICLVVGGDEQPLPGLAEASRATVVLRDLITRTRAATALVHVQVIAPWTPAWVETVGVLVPARLNHPDPLAAPERWAAASTVARLVPRADAIRLLAPPRR